MKKFESIVLLVSAITSILVLIFAIVSFAIRVV